LVKIEDVLEHLESISGKVGNLTEELDIVANYWEEMEMILENMLKHAGQLQNMKIWRLRAGELRKDWRRVKADYSDYAMQVRYSCVTKSTPNSHLVTDFAS
jgi:hypothetical protein